VRGAAVFLIGDTLGTSSFGELRPAAELPLVRRIAIEQRLTLCVRELDVADPKTH
jgi:hypothetical protein